MVFVARVKRITWMPQCKPTGFTARQTHSLQTLGSKNPYSLTYLGKDYTSMLVPFTAFLTWMQPNLQYLFVAGHPASQKKQTPHAWETMVGQRNTHGLHLAMWLHLWVLFFPQQFDHIHMSVLSLFQFQPTTTTQSKQVCIHLLVPGYNKKQKLPVFQWVSPTVQ